MSRTHEDIEDELLVLQCQDGDAKALAALIARWQPRLGRLAWRLTGEREAARDIVQDAWLTIVRRINRLDDPARFRSWAYRIVSNRCVDWTRRRVVQRKATIELQSTASSAFDELTITPDTVDELACMRDALRKLPDNQRAILSLHYLDEMSVAQIAHVLGLPEGTVKSRLFHARNRLKQAMERVET